MRPSLAHILGICLTAAALAVSSLSAPGLAGAAAKPAQTPAPNCGGTTIYKPDGSAWKCTFDDEFTGYTLDSTKWTVQQTATSGFTTGPVGSEVCYLNSPNNVSVSGGYLNLTVAEGIQALRLRCAERLNDHRRHGKRIRQVQPDLRPIRSPSEIARDDNRGTAGDVLALARRIPQNTARSRPAEKSTSPSSTAQVSNLADPLRALHVGNRGTPT